MFEVGLANVCEEINEAFSKANYQRVESLLWPALDQFSDIPQLWFYAGNVFFQTGRPALAARCFEHCVELDTNPLILANLGASYRRLNQHENGLAVLRAALEINPDYEPALVNLGAMYVNEGCPEKGIPHLEKACALGAAKGRLETGASWNLGLLYLEAGRFGEGFDIYRLGYGAERLVRNYGFDGGAEPKRLEPDDHAAAVAGAALGKARPTLIVWGEQGIGDELMFASILCETIAHYDIAFECHPRLERIYRNSRFARLLYEQRRELHIFPTRKEDAISWPKELGLVAQYKCAIGDLASFYRRDAASYVQASERFAPFYDCNPLEAADYEDHLRGLAGDRPVVGLATKGGVLTTARAYRTMRLEDIEYLFDNTDAFFVSLDYDDMTPLTFHLHGKYPGRFAWLPSIVQHWDFDHTGALMGATDMNVLVCQSAAHLSAGMGKATRVLAPKRAAWREILVPSIGTEKWYLWPNNKTKIYMQKEAGEWKEPLDRVIADIKALS